LIHARDSTFAKENLKFLTIGDQILYYISNGNKGIISNPTLKKAYNIWRFHSYLWGAGIVKAGIVKALGAPCSDEYEFKGGLKQDFANGSCFWANDYGIHHKLHADQQVKNRACRLQSTSTSSLITLQLMCIQTLITYYKHQLLDKPTFVSSCAAPKAMNRTMSLVILKMYCLRAMSVVETFPATGTTCTALSAVPAGTYA
jgi:hypothetical protein